MACVKAVVEEVVGSDQSSTADITAGTGMENQTGRLINPSNIKAHKFAISMHKSVLLFSAD